jgi:hypothetical protein
MITWMKECSKASADAIVLLEKGTTKVVDYWDRVDLTNYKFNSANYNKLYDDMLNDLEIGWYIIETDQIIDRIPLEMFLLIYCAI